MVLFDNNIPVFCPVFVLESLLDGTINVEYMSTTPSPYTHANDVHVRACARYESKPTSIVPSYHQTRFFFVPRAMVRLGVRGTKRGLDFLTGKIHRAEKVIKTKMTSFDVYFRMEKPRFSNSHWFKSYGHFFGRDIFLSLF